MSVNLLTDEPSKISPLPSFSAGVSEGPSNLKDWLARNSKLLLAVVTGLYGLLFLDLLRRMLAKTGGSFVFPLDDTYITMALAKNFALHGSWSLAHGTFQSATSTPAFLLLLAGLYRITGPTVWGALLLSFAFGVLAIFLAYRMLRGARPSIAFLALVCIVIFSPLPVLGLLGMEHTLHLALVLLFLPVVGDAIASGVGPSWGLLLLSAAMVATRYESLFLVAVAGWFFVGQRRFRAGIVLWSASAAPVLVYGLISLAHGCYWLPHSISLKGYTVNASLWAIPAGLRLHLISCLARAPYLGALLGIMLVLLLPRAVRQDRRACSALGIVSGAIILHLLLADVGWVYRYEAYLVASSIAAVAGAAGCVDPRRYRWETLALGVLCLLGTYKLAERAWDAEVSLPERSASIYFQQIQMARFLERLEPGIAVAANDVGAINFFADIRCTDLVGLADKEIFWRKRNREYSTNALSDLATARHVNIAIVYDSWFNSSASYVAGPNLPSSWVRIQEWLTPYGQFVGAPVVTFYAVDTGEASRFKQTLEDFDTSLPQEVRVLRGSNCLSKKPCL